MTTVAGGEGGTRIFIRDDDVGALTPEFLAFFRRFADRGVPVSYQIIPEQLTDECAGFLLVEQARNPGLVELGQHGLRHEMMVRGKVEYYEFGPERTYEQQSADIRAGLALLRERLGSAADLRVFTPPRHRYDRNTLKAARAAGFEILSSSSYTSLRHRMAYGAARAIGLTNLGRPGDSWHGQVRPDSGLFELSIAVGADNGPTEPVASPAMVVAGVERARRHTRDVGIMFHHGAYRGREGQQFLDELLRRLIALPGVSFHTIGDIYDRRAAAAA